MVEYREPKIEGPLGIFRWWLREVKKEKPFIKHPFYPKIRKNFMLPKHLDVKIIVKNKYELQYLKNKVLKIDAEIIELEKSDLKKYYFTTTTYKIYSLKKEIAQINEKIKKLEKANPDGTKVLMTYKTFVKIIELYNKKAIQALIEGSSINLKNNLGYLYIMVKRKKDKYVFSNINWGASKKYRDELIAEGKTPKSKENPKGKNWFQFYEEDDYFRVAWVKNYGACRVKNNLVYAFYPFKSKKGMTKSLVKAIKKDEYLKDNYIRVKD